jgi:CheY-like chemotaxis protein
MTDSIVYVRTNKGRAEVDSGTGALAKGLRSVLALVDDHSTYAELKTKLTNVPEEKLRAAVDRLVAEGYIEAAIASAAAGDDLDFTLDLPAPEPSSEERARAERQTIGGMRSLHQAGYYVNITSRPGHRLRANSGGKYCVLIVDGDASNSLLLARTLMLADLEVRTASNRDEVLRELGKKPLPDAIVMDTVLPKLNGLNLLSRLRQHERYASVPIIIVTANKAQEDVVAALARGASGYMTKPFKPEALVESINAVLGLG